MRSAWCSAMLMLRLLISCKLEVVDAQGVPAVVRVPIVTGMQSDSGKVKSLFSRIRVDECRAKLAKALLTENGCETEASSDHGKIAQWLQTVTLKIAERLRIDVPLVSMKEGPSGKRASDL